MRPCAHFLRTLVKRDLLLNVRLGPWTRGEPSVPLWVAHWDIKRGGSWLPVYHRMALQYRSSLFAQRGASGSLAGTTTCSSVTRKPSRSAFEPAMCSVGLLSERPQRFSGLFAPGRCSPPRASFCTDGFSARGATRDGFNTPNALISVRRHLPRGCTCRHAGRFFGKLKLKQPPSHRVETFSGGGCKRAGGDFVRSWWAGCTRVHADGTEMKYLFQAFVHFRRETLMRVPSECREHVLCRSGNENPLTPQAIELCQELTNDRDGSAIFIHHNEMWTVT